MKIALDCLRGHARAVDRVRDYKKGAFWALRMPSEFWSCAHFERTHRISYQTLLMAGYVAFLRGADRYTPIGCSPSHTYQNTAF